MSVSQPSPEFLAEDVRSNTIIVCCVCMGLALASFVMRVAARGLQRDRLLISDHLALAGLLCALAVSIIVLNNARLGVGLHIQRVPYSNIRTILLTSFMGEFFYGVGFTLIKLSILLLYRRIFVTRLVKVGSIFLAVFVILWGIAFVIVCIFDCNPINGYWDLNVPSKCLSQSDFYIGFAVPNMVADVLMMTLPLRDIWALQLNLRIKAGLFAVFVLAGLVVIASGLRIHFMLTMDPMDVTFTYVGVAVWTAVEIDIAVMCACLPTVRPVVVWFIGTARTWTQKSKWSENSVTELKSSRGGSRPTRLASQDNESQRHMV
ncbi:hypothetical protein SCUP234_05717 [Seiridium cupressi]